MYYYINIFSFLFSVNYKQQSVHIFKNLSKVNKKPAFAAILKFLENFKTYHSSTLTNIVFFFCPYSLPKK